MAVLDVEKLLEGIPGADPCGADPEYDADFLAMEREVQGKPEQQFGDTVVPAQQGDWRKVREAAQSLLSKSKDLRVATYLTRAMFRTEGPEAWADAITVIKGLLERYWEGVHPRLDPDDGDATARMNALGSLSGSDSIAALRNAPFIAATGLGHFSLRDHDIATNRVPAPPDTELPKLGILQAVFAANTAESVAAASTALARARQDVRAIETIAAEHAGVGFAVDLSPLATTLGSIGQVFEEHLARSGGTAGTGDTTSTIQTGDGGALRSGDVKSREDVIRLLDKACEYFERYEPSSPVPILLRRSKRLVSKNFMDIIRDLAPDSLTQIETIRGSEGE